MSAKPNSERDQDQPIPIGLNVDTMERENDPGPFLIVLNGKRYVLPDPWTMTPERADEIAADPEKMKAHMVSAMGGDPEKAEEFDAAWKKLELWQSSQILNGYGAHYGMSMNDLGKGLVRRR